MMMAAEDGRICTACGHKEVPPEEESCLNCGTYVGIEEPELEAEVPPEHQDSIEPLSSAPKMESELSGFDRKRESSDSEFSSESSLEEVHPKAEAQDEIENKETDDLPPQVGDTSTPKLGFASTCAYCGRLHPPEARFCPSTGKQLPLATPICPKCGKAVAADWVHCPNCGIGLDQIRVTPAPQTRPTLFIFILLGLIVVCLGMGIGFGLVWLRNQVGSPLAMPVSATYSPIPSPSSSRTLLYTPILTPSPSPTPSYTPIPPLEAGATMISPVDGMVMVYVPEGEFLMNSLPQYTAYLGAFWIDRTEVTNAMYADFLNEMGNQSEGGVLWLDADADGVLIEQQGQVWQPKNGFADHPVIEVNWYGAKAYCEWADRRLPTEAEWEHAARGRTGLTYPWGHSVGCGLAQFSPCLGGLKPVGSFPDGASPYDVLDMAGNAAEWIADWYEIDYYDESPIVNPQNPVSGNFRLVRGGSWRKDVIDMRTYYRNQYPPNITRNDIGFRCAQDAGQQYPTQTTSISIESATVTDILSVTSALTSTPTPSATLAITFAPPIIERIYPNTGVQGEVIALSVFGQNFVENPIVAFNRDVITVISVEIISDTEVHIEIAISDEATAGWYDLTITNPDGRSDVVTDALEIQMLLFTNVSYWAGIGKYGQRGVAWGDYDGDGHIDLIVTNNRTLYHNEGNGTFSRIFSGPRVGGEGSAWGDYDNDGDLDLYAADWADLNTLFRNEGEGFFSDVTKISGLRDSGKGQSVAWGDYDNDGNLDLYITNRGNPNHLFHNEGDGIFKDVTDQAGVSDNGNSVGLAWGDYDKDGDPDLYITNDGGENRLFQNQGDGTFIDRAAELGVTAKAYGGGVGVAWGDYDNDDDLDLAVGTNNRVLIFRNDGDTFTDVSNRTGVGGSKVSAEVGVSWADYDNDGWLDLFITGREMAALYHNQGNGIFKNVTESTGVDSDRNWGSAWGDYDNDGDLDLFVVRGGLPELGESDLQDILYRNNNNNGNHWLHVKVIGTISNCAGIGSRVRVITDGSSQLREVNSGTNHRSQDSLPVEFGFGTYDGTVTVEITWPSGIQQVLSDVHHDQFITVTEPKPNTGILPQQGYLTYGHLYPRRYAQ